VLWEYDLPPERIAEWPVEPRHNARLLIYQPGRTLHEDIFLNLDRHLPENTLLLYNDSQVVFARLRQGRREVLLTEPVAGGWHLPSGQIWQGLYRPGRFWRKGGTLTWEKPPVRLTIQAAAHPDLSLAFRLEWEPAAWPLVQVLNEVGEVPLPPYIRRAASEADKTRYQTVYAHMPGSIAAPTAGLHFTEAVFARLTEKGIRRLPITLHVGAGTFLPLRSENPFAHEMHAETFSVRAETLTALRTHTGPIVCVGTTTCRTVESLYWLGAYRLWQGDFPTEVPPFCWRELEAPPPLTDALDALGSAPIHSRTRLYILPGYPFALTQGLITNFHQPQSTLIGLVQAFIGEEAIRAVYTHALEHGFRFLSYGDTSLLWRKAF
jgi:S-adenosylmethionine:tRNA ribosyltransferase-isomerase